MRLPGVVLAFALLASGCGDERSDQRAEKPGVLTREELLDPKSCAPCHPDHVREWSGSMHAYAATDPVFLAMNRRGQRETNGELGSFCVKCHAPMALLEGATTDGLNLDDVAPHLKGVTCYFCHTVESVAGDHNNQLVLDGSTTMRGPLRSPTKTPAHPSAYSSLHDAVSVDSAALCGSCHDVVSDKGTRVERTFAQWQESLYAKESCGRCHMKRVKDSEGPGRHHRHGFEAIDLALVPFPEMEAQRNAVEESLARATQSALCVVQRPEGAAIRVVLNTLGIGHALPSGAAQHRRLWTEVIAYRDGKIIYQSGAVSEDQAIRSADSDTWLLHSCLLDESGNETHRFWEAAGYQSNALPPHVPTVRYFPREKTAVLPTMPDRVTLRLRLRPIGLDVLDDLVRTGDLDIAVRDAMPTLDIDLGAGPLLEWIPSAAEPGYMEDDSLPVSCTTLSQLNLAAPKVEAAEPTMCSP